MTYVGAQVTHTWVWNSNYYSKVRIVNITHDRLDKDKYQFNHLCKNMNDDESQWWKRVLRKRLVWHTKLLNTILVIVMVCLLKQNISISAFFGVTSRDSRYTIHTYMHIYVCVCGVCARKYQTKILLIKKFYFIHKRTQLLLI